MDPSAQKCRRCTMRQASLIVRSEPLCRDCFTTYVTTKVVKRMAAFFRMDSSSEQQKTFLLPVSLGISSVSLLHVLTHHLEFQRGRAGRTKYRLHVLYVDSSESSVESNVHLFEALKRQYSEHSYSIVPLSIIFENDKMHEFSNDEESSLDLSSVQKLHRLLNLLASSTSKADVLHTFLIRVIVQFAKSHSIDGILWGDCTTRMAERVLSESAKGRGYSLPWQVTDGDTPYGISFFYPLKDIFKKELYEFIKLTDPPLESFTTDSNSSDLKTQAPASLRNSTIDILMKQYFESAEEQYPSIVSNVVRTSGRLHPGIIGMQRCKLCTLPVTKDQLGIEGWEGIQEIEVSKTDGELGLCYGCSRSVPAEAISLLP